MTFIAKQIETPSKVTYAVSHTVAEGAKSVTIITGSAFVGTILGDTSAASKTFTFTAQAGNILGDIPIVLTAGSVEVLTTV
jgi:hypothetical protein